MTTPVNIEIQAVRLLTDAGYLWDDSLYAFRRVRRVGRETTQQYLNSPPLAIAFEELEDHGLVLRDRNVGGAGTTASTDPSEGFRWLAERIKQNSAGH
jgi:hypothetical protein